VLLDTYRTYHGNILPCVNTPTRIPHNNATTALLSHLTSRISNFGPNRDFNNGPLEPEASAKTISAMLLLRKDFIVKKAFFAGGKNKCWPTFDFKEKLSTFFHS
jgi:hypothetical protein